MNVVRFKNRELSPSKIVCVGRNYAEHAKELGNEIPSEMVLFLKPNSAISNTLISFHDEPLHYELEIAFLVEQGLYSGLGLGIDLTKRELQSRLKKSGLPWERAKAFNQSAIFTRFIDVPSDPKIIETFHFTLHIDGQLAQHGHVSNMLFKPDQILEECGSFVSLEDGDIIMTGTPKGVGVINKGSCFAAHLYQADKLVLEMEWLAQ